MGPTLTVPSELRVLQIIGNLDIGGAQEVVRTLADYLKQNDCFVVVCSLRDGPIRQEIEKLGIPVEIIDGRRSSITSFPAYIRDLRRIRSSIKNLVNKYQVNIVQTHLLRALDFLVLSIKNRSGLPLVFWTVHNQQYALRADQIPQHKWLLKPKQSMHRRLYRTLARRSNGWIAVSDEVGTAIRQDYRLPSKTRVILNGVDTQRYPAKIDRERFRQALGLHDDTRVAVVVGTLKEQKGHRVLIEAAQILAPTHPNLVFLLAGDGALRSELEDQARTAGLDGQVRFLGSRSDIPELLAASDLFVLPSLWEGLPMALIEAMASSLPVIATRVSGTQNAMIPNRTGLVVEPGDPQALAEAITAVLAGPAHARDMGRAARQRIEECYSAQAQAKAHIALYLKEFERLSS